MNLKTVKTQKEAAEAAGVPLELTMLDGNFTELRIGNLFIRHSNYSVTISKLVEFDEATRWKVESEIEGFGKSVKYFEYDFEAKAHQAGLPEIAESELKQVKVGIRDGEVVKEL